MHTSSSRVAALLALGWAAGMPSPAAADSGAQPIAAAASRDAGGLLDFGTVLDDQALASHRGGQDEAFINDMRSRAAISQTSTSNLSTGSNTITDGSFAGASGLPMVIQNSGNNVIIQNSTILNLQLK
jgi:hypothetical protein